ncbi:polysaccharide export protein Wza [Variovorax sp. PBS-H4]|uniref:polysaccharide biosynthesis/export family protein n=1 Tax=Variovorax sp. PBS-H4 TaxID=434008 RepID=UPI001319729B|nr:polysaccharide biosynthesis/export family protein [Variovorax sp. PBS-H4]VTU40976.1 polysaccharide export protein Wza [Variovorax sp. PBS-H4]
MTPFLRCALICTAAVLSGCAVAPGVNFGGTVSAPAASSDSPSSDAADPPPPGALQSITSELIRSQRAAQANVVVGSDVKRLFGVAQPYRIGSGDILNIVVWDHPDLVLAPAGSLTTDAITGSPVSNGYNVGADGTIQFPYVGSFKVAGLTESEVRDRLVARLAKYFSEPKVTVRIQSYRAGRVYVDGEVRAPGLQAVNDIPMTLPEAIHRAGGFTAEADRSSVSVSRSGTSTVVDLPRLTALGVNPNDILLAAGDLVRVLSREDAKVYVMGEVTRPVAQPLRNGRLTLNQALGEAGGVSTTTGNPQQIYVVRAGAAGSVQIFHLDASTPVAYALAEGFELKARDVVYVDPVALVRWNRVVSLILPSAQVVNVANNVK